MKLIVSEIFKIWSKKTFILIFAALIAANLFLLWTETDGSFKALPPAYKKLTAELSDLNFEEKQQYIEKLFNQIDGIASIEKIQIEAAANPKEFTENLMTENADILKKYSALYQSGNYLFYTDNLLTEHEFLREIYEEMKIAADYGDYLKDIRARADMLSEISIFQTQDSHSYTTQSIQKTVSAYEKMSPGLVNDYSPQKGLQKALEFKLTDILLLVFILFTAAAIIRDEKENGMIKLIYISARGHISSAAAKLCAMTLCVLIMTIALYGVNLIYCQNVYGLGNLFRGIQSVPFLVHSVLKIDILTYILLFMLIKWLGASVIGLWVLLCTIICQKFYTALILSLSFLGINYLLYAVISATGWLSIFKYGNLAGLLDTNGMLGQYQLLYLLGTPVSRALIVTGAFFFLLLCLIMTNVYCFSKGFFLRQPSGKKSFLFSAPEFKRRKKLFLKTIPSSSDKSCDNAKRRVKSFEHYKLFRLNGALWLILLFICFEIYSGITAVNYRSAEDIFYRKYMTHLTGVLTPEKVQWLNTENEKFKPLYELEAALNSGEINSEEYAEASAVYTGLITERAVLENILNEKLPYIKEHKNAQLVYESGFNQLFDIKNTRDLKDCLIALLILVISLGNIFASERTTNMDRLLAVTPLGKDVTVKIKLKLAAALGAFTAFISLFSVYIEVLKNYGIKGLWVSAASLEYFEAVPGFLPVAAMLLLQYIMRAFACICAAFIICALSYRIGSGLMTIFSCVLLLCIPPLLALCGADTFKWAGFYPLFHWNILIFEEASAAAAWLYIPAAAGLCLFCAHTLIKKFGCLYGR